MERTNGLRAATGAPRAGGGRLKGLPRGILIGFLGALLLGAGSLPPAGGQTRAEFVPTFATNARVKQQIERLQRLAAQKLWDEWLTTYQQLVADPEDLVLPRDPEFLVGLRYHCHQLLAALPPAVRQRYRVLYDAEARRLYEKATREGDEAGLRAVYTRYRFSSYANRALLRIADRALDEGRVEIARVAYGRLAKEPGVTAPLLLRYALAAAAAGSTDEARAALERVRREFGALPITLGGRNLSAAEAADEVAAAIGPLATRPRELGWPAFEGTDGSRRMPASAAGEWRRLWEYVFPTPLTTGSRIIGPAVIGGYSSTRARFSFLTFPVVQGERVWVQGPRSLTALRLASGERLWTATDFNLGQSEIAVERPSPRLSGYSIPSTRPVQAAPALEDPLLVSRIPLAASESEYGRWPADFALAAYDARSGRQLWRRIAGGDPRGTYFNIPAVRGKTVFTSIATNKGGITECTAVALDAATGEPIWSTYLGAGSDPLALTDGSPPAIRDGLVWIESGLYTLNALDIVTGELRLIYRYTPVRAAGGYRFGIDSTPLVVNEPISLIATAGGPILFAPRWGTEVTAIDPAAGKLLWSAPKAAGGSSRGALFGVDEKRVYLCGDSLQALQLADGARVWNWEPDVPASNIGFAALAGERVYLVIEGRLHVRAANDGRELEVIDLSEALGDSAGMTTVTALGDLLLVATRDRLLAFGSRRKETALHPPALFASGSLR